MNKTEKDFFNVFTDFQCFILANMNKGNSSGITASHYNIIDFIYRKKDITGKDLAIAFNVSQAAISKQLKFIIKNGLAKQSQNPMDRRSFKLLITEKGKFIIDNSENFRANITKQFSSQLNTDEFETFTNLLKKVLKNLK
ncbi:MarR family transcriptional regulator [Flavobacterium pectinovorum]|jgi:DNA-binding MarR family transcriptional regulator|uniref:MarR family transcriptional regulator n=1 Tax=Flavobacterium pectinovorum TaxID=29533 RepID=A0A502F7H2_9FLAO|nr:MarR family transcriptional regulator [Flavobacterium pectinovorum]TPG45316.1 MarR family transcriptional regulator [Flavobacterium pectinovorum]